VGPTLIAHGTAAQKQRYLPALLRGDEVWCQLFSEPGAGSDLAGLRTRAVRDGDEWVVNGQKVWSSGAHHSELGILLARTDPDPPKHQGITYFVLDMRSPGIEVRPLRQINGVAHFNEVFLTDVRIPHENVVGDVNGGWAVAQTTLGAERTLIGSGGAVGFRDLARLAREQDRAGDSVLRQRLADAYIRFEILKYLGQRAQAARRNGAVGAEASVLKLAVSRHVALNGDLALALEGATGMLLHDDAPYGGFWQQQFLNQWGTRIGGGTEQVQQNVIGERVLGLPPEPRPDKSVPFRELAGN
jgi:alkylation response protein AidB-like acyl-CoA dehydrogenase